MWVKKSYKSGWTNPFISPSHTCSMTTLFPSHSWTLRYHCTTHQINQPSWLGICKKPFHIVLDYCLSISIFVKHPAGHGSREQRTFIFLYRCLMRLVPQQVSERIRSWCTISLIVNYTRGAATHSLDSITPSKKKKNLTSLESINNLVNIVSYNPTPRK